MQGFTLFVFFFSPKTKVFSKNLFSDFVINLVICNQDWTNLDEGWMFGRWESGPWLAYHTKRNAFGRYGWVMSNYIIKCEMQCDLILTEPIQDP